ncbi:hypothetical protein N431DRAFT_543529 [Stipitochalara longipes BDJ]|nr:hypothetical protein N431DRAFT_543529 [Stipitochalara longipes BDJ]
MPNTTKGKEKYVEETNSQSSPLLSLVPEIRLMVWKAAVAMDPILILGRAYTDGAPMKVTSLASIALPPNYLDTKCGDLHQEQFSKKGKKSKKSKAPTPLSWLCTNRQVYTEAQSVLYQHMTVHCCSALVFHGLFLQSPKSILNPSLLRSLSFCLTLVIVSDLRNGFCVSRGGVVAHGWETGHGPNCCCPFCFATGSLFNITDQLPAVRELRLRISFMCRRNQGNFRPVIGQYADGRPKKGQLYRPKNPDPLVCVDDRLAIEEFVEEYCGLWPLRIFAGRKMKAIFVHFCTEEIVHDPSNQCPHPSDKCWCRGRSIDRESLQVSGIAKDIQKRMLGES